MSEGLSSCDLNVDREVSARNKVASTKSILLQPMDMNHENDYEISVVVAVLTGAVAAPAFAYEAALEFQAANSNAQAPHVMKRSARALHSTHWARWLTSRPARCSLMIETFLMLELAAKAKPARA
jgi:hypothetical protein